VTGPGVGWVGVPLPDDDPDGCDDVEPVEPDVDDVVPDEPKLLVVDVVPPAPVPAPVVDEPEPVPLPLPVGVEPVLPFAPVAPRPASVPVPAPAPPVASAPPLESAPALAAPPLDDWVDEIKPPVGSFAFDGDAAPSRLVVACVDRGVEVGAEADAVPELVPEAAGATAALPDETACSARGRAGCLTPALIAC